MEKSARVSELPATGQEEVPTTGQRPETAARPTRMTGKIRNKLRRQLAPLSRRWMSPPDSDPNPAKLAASANKTVLSWVGGDDDTVSIVVCNCSEEEIIFVVLSRVHTVTAEVGLGSRPNLQYQAEVFPLANTELSTGALPSRRHLRQCICYNSVYSVRLG